MTDSESSKRGAMRFRLAGQLMKPWLEPFPMSLGSPDAISDEALRKRSPAIVVGTRT